MKLFTATEPIDATPDHAWATWTDVNHWSQWDPHEEDATFAGVFEAGATGWAKPKGAPSGDFSLLEVVPGCKWVSHSPLPGGGLTFTHLIEPAGQGCVASLIAEVRGPLGPLIKLIWARRMTRDAPQTLRALGAEAARRASAPR